MSVYDKYNGKLNNVRPLKLTLDDGCSTVDILQPDMDRRAAVAVGGCLEASPFQNLLKSNFTKSDNFDFNYSRKPRLSHAQGLCGKDIPSIVNYYQRWVSFSEYLPIEYEHSETHEHIVRCLKASKRGNDVYAWKLRKRIPKIKQLDDLVYHNTIKSSLVFLTLEFNTHDINNFDSWLTAPYELNLFMANLRKKYHGVKMVVRAFEAHQSGWIHAHVLLNFNDKMPMVRTYSHHRSCWIYYIPDNVRKTIKSCWSNGYSDVLGMPTVAGGYRYTMKYIMKNNDVNKASTHGDISTGQNKALYTLAMNWYLHHRSFYIMPSAELESLVRRDSTLSISNLFQRELDGGSHHVWILIKAYPITRFLKDVKLWHFTIKVSEFEKLVDHQFDKDNRIIQVNDKLVNEVSDYLDIYWGGLVWDPARGCDLHSDPVGGVARWLH